MARLSDVDLCGNCGYWHILSIPCSNAELHDNNEARAYRRRKADTAWQARIDEAAAREESRNDAQRSSPGDQC